MNIAFVAVGRRVELVRAFRLAQQSLKLNGRLIGIDTDPLAPALQVCDHSCLVPRLDEPGFLDSLIQLCTREEVNLMLPLIDPMIEILAEHRSDIESTGAKVSVVSLESARMTSDKKLVSEFFERLGLPTPRSWLPDELDPSNAPYPLFIKPRSGSASRDAYKIRNPRELIFFRDYIPDPIIQEYIPGPEITSDVVCDLEGTLLGIVSRRRIEVRSGEVSKGITVHDPIIQDACERIAEALPAVGPITVQCIMKNEEPIFTEINARLGGGVPLAIAAGFDVPAALLASLTQVKLDIPEIGTYETGLHITRFDESFFLPNEIYPPGMRE